MIFPDGIALKNQRVFLILLNTSTVSSKHNTRKLVKSIFIIERISCSTINQCKRKSLTEFIAINPYVQLLALLPNLSLPRKQKQSTTKNY